LAISIFSTVTLVSAHLVSTGILSAQREQLELENLKSSVNLLRLHSIYRQRNTEIIVSRHEISGGSSGDVLFRVGLKDFTCQANQKGFGFDPQGNNRFSGSILLDTEKKARKMTFGIGIQPVKLLP